MARCGSYPPIGCKIKTGTYTGDGSTGQAITGIGFQPKKTSIRPHLTSGAGNEEFVKTDQHTNDLCFHHKASGPHEDLADRINSLDSDGFTVEDAGSDQHPNKNAQVYDFLCLG